MPRQAKAIYYEHVDTVEPSLAVTSNQRSNDHFCKIQPLILPLFTMITSNQQPYDHFCKIQPLILPLIVVMNNKERKILETKQNNLSCVFSGTIIICVLTLN